MMKTLLITLFIFLATSVFAQDVKKQTTKQLAKTSVENVYICNGSSSKKYHKIEKCRGLSNCSTKTEKITKDAAIKKGRTACKICYK